MVAHSTKRSIPIELLRDPEDRRVAVYDQAAVREKMLDKDLTDSYPASDPPSSMIPPAIRYLWTM